jgi:hypothetical protein
MIPRHPGGSAEPRSLALTRHPGASRDLGSFSKGGPGMRRDDDGL